MSRRAGRTNSSKLTMADTGLPGSPNTGVAEAARTPNANGFAGRMATCIHRIFPALSFSRTTRTRSRSPTLTPPLVMMASHVDAADDSNSTRRDSSSPTIPRSMPSHPSRRTRARRVWRLASRILPGGSGPDPEKSSSPVESTPTRGRGWTSTLESALIGQNAQVGGSEDGSRRGDDIADGDIASRLADEVTSLQLTSDDDAAPIGGRFGLFDHAHGVGSGWERCTGHDARRLARADGSSERVAGHDGADHRKTDGCARSVLGPDRVAVHGRVGERGDLLGRDDRGAQHATKASSSGSSTEGRGPHNPTTNRCASSRGIMSVSQRTEASLRRIRRAKEPTRARSHGHGIPRLRGSTRSSRSRPPRSRASRSGRCA